MSREEEWRVHSEGLAGYAHPAFAAVYRDLGTVRLLPHCGGFVLERTVGHTGLRDAMCCYPLFCCQDWGGLQKDLESMNGDLVSLVLVADPFGAPAEAGLTSLFDLVVPFKTHYIADLSRPVSEYVSK